MAKKTNNFIIQDVMAAISLSAYHPHRENVYKFLRDPNDPTIVDRQQYIVDAGLTSGVFVGKENQFCTRVGTTWQYEAPTTNVLVYLIEDEDLISWDGSNWVQADLGVLSNDQPQPVGLYSSGVSLHASRSDHAHYAPGQTSDLWYNGGEIASGGSLAVMAFGQLFGAEGPSLTIRDSNRRYFTVRKTAWYRVTAMAQISSRVPGAVEEGVLSLSKMDNFGNIDYVLASESVKSIEAIHGGDTGVTMIYDGALNVGEKIGMFLESLSGNDWNVLPAIRIEELRDARDNPNSLAIPANDRRSLTTP